MQPDAAIAKVHAAASVAAQPSARERACRWLHDQRVTGYSATPHEQRHAGSGAALAFLEAAYAWELDEDRWLRGVLDAGVRVWGHPHWAYAFCYDVADLAHRWMSRPIFWGASREAQKLFTERLIARASHPDIVFLNRSLSMGFARPVGGVDELDARAMSRTRTPDMFVLNGLDGGGRGCLVAFGTERTTLDTDEILLYQRLVAHLSSAFRCRRRLQQRGVDPVATSEAVLRPDGRVLDATGAAETAGARAALTEAARSIERTRRGRGGEAPTSRWPPRINARWTLVDGPADQRERHLLARENQARPLGFDVLTERERQVVVSVASGRSLKESAYELGISYATTRVLLARAYSRLGVASRGEFFALPTVRALRGEPEAG
jgi:DNA-binding CsgD family transcriptional regulator